MREILSTPFGRGAVLVICALLFSFCDTLAAYWGKNNSTWALVLVLLLAPFSYIFFGLLSQRYPLSIIAAWVNVAIFVFTLLVGLFYFHDQISLRQGIGLGLSFIAIILMIV